jgi:hypothetical protein
MRSWAVTLKVPLVRPAIGLFIGLLPTFGQAQFGEPPFAWQQAMGGKMAFQATRIGITIAATRVAGADKPWLP